jgi:hypothetical protein
VLQVSGLLDRTMYGEPVALCSAEDGNYLPEPSGRIDGKSIRGFDFTPPRAQSRPAPHAATAASRSGQ